MNAILYHAMNDDITKYCFLVNGTSGTKEIYFLHAHTRFLGFVMAAP